MDLAHIVCILAIFSWNCCSSRKYSSTAAHKKGKNRYFNDKAASTTEDLSADYDVIEVFQNSSSGLTDNEIEFVALHGKTCAVHCVKGLSGLCICPPPSTPLTFLPNAATDSHPWSPASADSSMTGRRTQHLKYPTISRSRLRYDRVKREDDDEEDNQKLCKCRHCRKLFKRTLYCRVFPCYQKKCKSGEWKDNH